MIDLTKKALPNTVMVGGRAFPIDTDFRIWMRFSIEFERWKEDGMTGELDISYLFKNELPVFRRAEDYSEILLFAFPPVICPKHQESGQKVFDYAVDADYIFSAFMETYGIDLTEVNDLHWHKFNALLSGIGTKLTDIIGYRSYTGEKIKSNEEMCRRLKYMWELPEVESEEEKESEEKFDRFFE